MKKRFLPFIAIFVLAVILVGFYSQDPKSSRTPGVQTDINNPVVPQTNAIVKYVDSLNGANDSVALKNRGYKIRRGALMGPPGTNNGWFQGNATVTPAFNGPTTGYVAANYNTVSGTNTIDLWLISPTINASAGDTISFYAWGANAGFVDSIRVHWASNGDTMASTGSWVELGRFQAVNPWNERRFVIPSGAPAGRFAINYRVINGGPTGANSDYIGVDFIRVLGPPAPTNTTLLMFHDTVVVNQGRTDDRDTMRKYLGPLAGSYDQLGYTNTTVLPSLAGYNTIVLQETANDGANFLLSAAQRTALMNWLNTGTPAARKRLIMVGADLGYNYSRSGATQRDTVFSQQVAGFVYRVDNASATPFTITGTNVDVGGVRTMTSTPTGGFGFWPDGNSPNNGGVHLYRHTLRGFDSVAAIGRYSANYTVASTFQDPRYFVNGGFANVMTALWNFSLGTVGVDPINNVVPGVYSLSQNYPNPFNPVTNIKFGLPTAGNVKLVVFDILGREVATLVNEFKAAGQYKADFDASLLSSGVYFYRIESGNFVETKKMLLVK